MSDPNQVGVGSCDELTLDVDLEGPTGYFPQLLADSITYPVPRHILEVHGEAWSEAENIVTSGPFRLDQWLEGECLRLVRDPTYRCHFGGNLQCVELSLVTDPATRLHMYESGDLVPEGMPGHSPGIGLTYDPELARQTLRGSGYAGCDHFSDLRLIAPCGAERVFGYVQTQWQEVLQVKVNWETLEWAKFSDRLVTGTPHLFVVGWSADYPDPDSMLRTSRVSGGWAGWRNETYDALIKKARRTLNQEERMTLYRQADQILVEKAPLIPLTYGRRPMLVKPWVRKSPASPIKWCFFKDVVIEPH